MVVIPVMTILRLLIPVALGYFVSSDISQMTLQTGPDGSRKYRIRERSAGLLVV